MNPQNKKLVIFDFDGVLVDTLFIVYSINKDADTTLTIEQFKNSFESSYKVLKEDGSSSYHPRFNELYKNQTRDLVIPEVFKNTIKKLSEFFYLVIVSSTDSSLIETILKRENVFLYFNKILGSNINANKMTKIKNLLDEYNLNSDNAVFITDTSGDIKEGLKCNVRSIAVTWGFHDRETLEKANPIVIIDDPRDLLDVIKNAFPITIN